MDDDTAAVVIIGFVVFISVVAGYAAYMYVSRTSQEPIVYNFPHTFRRTSVSQGSSYHWQNQISSLLNHDLQYKILQAYVPSSAP